MVSGIAVASSVLAHDYGGVEVSYRKDERIDISYPLPPVKVNRCKKTYEVKHPWYKGRTALYIATIVTSLAIIVLVVAGVVGGGIMRVISGPRDATTPSGSTTGGDNHTGVTSTPATPELTSKSAATTPSPTVPPTVSPTAFERTDPLAFYVMGDVPYTYSEEHILRNQLTQMTNNLHPGAAFLVHVGDIQEPRRTECASGSYKNVRNMLRLAPVPTFVLAGDNDSLDCPYPETAWGHYQDNFINFEQEWLGGGQEGGAHFLAVGKVERWEDHPEMFSFIEDRILFLSVNLLHGSGGEDESGYYAGLANSKAWVTQQLTEMFHQNAIRGVVMFGHGLIHGSVEEFFVDIMEVFLENQVLVPVLYMHGDGHEFVVNEDFAYCYEWDYFTAIQVDGGAEADPLLVEVAMVKNGIMEPLVAENDMQTVIGNGLFRIDRQNGRY